ncbi:hypothetical protein BU23DRAFT_487713 [Bimuria novae-zelandiae CBS 107.79]|uniref:N-acetyltransferase domain-containing protein n=1 Tax=Bimuria novae-zelandiae CBS 107.79 TaxID=1447943 RepID=A0A6A5UQ12_9PLEO|nr:hypothetical protein BU23DRAFT_487713 [Bimuria novae-zelandiae CBS 107.79]
MANTIGSFRVDIVESKESTLNPANVKLPGVALNLLKLFQLQPTAAAVPPLPEGVRVVTAAEYKQAAACLADAFAEDDVVFYPIDTPDRAHWTKQEKWALHVEILEYVTYAHILKGLVTIVGDFEAVALWMPPASDMDDYLTILRSGMWRLNYRLSSEGRRRFFTEFLPLLHDTKHSTLGPRDDASWYLVYIGTSTRGRGKGHASKLIRHVTNQADKDGLPVYLESSNKKNPPIYRHFGFETVRTVYLHRAERNVELDIMVREPKSMEKQ